MMQFGMKSCHESGLSMRFLSCNTTTSLRHARDSALCAAGVNRLTQGKALGRVDERERWL